MNIKFLIFIFLSIIITIVTLLGFYIIDNENKKTEVNKLKDQVDKLQFLPSHLFNSDYSVEKCDELLEIGFYGKVGNLHTDKINSIEEQNLMYNDCVVNTKHLNK